jgi:hypothetical protein
MALGADRMKTRPTKTNPPIRLAHPCIETDSNASLSCEVLDLRTTRSATARNLVKRDDPVRLPVSDVMWVWYASG